ncbi:unnamed protein product [Sphagnum tenellum]
MLCIRFLAAPDSLRDVTYITNFAALEIRHILEEKLSRQEEMIPSSSVTVKKLLEWLMGLEAGRCWS